MQCDAVLIDVRSIETVALPKDIFYKVRASTTLEEDLNLQSGRFKDMSEMLASGSLICHKRLFDRMEILPSGSRKLCICMYNMII